MMEPDGFEMNLRFIPMLEVLNDKQRGRVLMSVFYFERSDDVPEDLDQAEQVAFNAIVQQMQINDN